MIPWKATSPFSFSSTSGPLIASSKTLRVFCEVESQHNPNPNSITYRSPKQKIMKGRQQTNLQLLSLQNSNLPQRPIPLPNPLPTQPDRPLLLILSQRHREQRAISRDDHVQRRVADLVDEDFAPLLVAETGLRVVELERVLLQLLFPGRGLLGGGGRVVGVDVPD